MARLRHTKTSSQNYETQHEKLDKNSQDTQLQHCYCTMLQIQYCVPLHTQTGACKYLCASLTCYCLTLS